MKRYIRCKYCQTILGLNKSFLPVPEDIYCIGCFAEERERSEWERENDSLEEILQEWEQ